MIFQLAKYFSDMLIGLILSGEVFLGAWRPYSQSNANQAKSFQRRYSRWLSNDLLDVEVVYASIIRKTLSSIEGEKLYLALDTTMLWDQICRARIILIYRDRAIPLAWKTLVH